MAQSSWAPRPLPSSCPCNSHALCHLGFPHAPLPLPRQGCPHPLSPHLTVTSGDGTPCPSHTVSATCTDCGPCRSPATWPTSPLSCLRSPEPVRGSDSPAGLGIRPARSARVPGTGQASTAGCVCCWMGVSGSAREASGSRALSRPRCAYLASDLSWHLVSTTKFLSSWPVHIIGLYPPQRI